MNRFCPLVEAGYHRLSDSKAILNSNLPESREPHLKAQRNLCLVGTLLVLIFLLIFAISGPFEYGCKSPRPILLVTGLLMVATVVALLGLKFALQLNNQSRSLLMLIVGCGISLRMIGLFTCPILEIDYYRYIWDGKVVSTGVSPYRYSPQQVLRTAAGNNPSLQKVASLSASSQSNHTILDRVHYKEYTSIYPPVSQLVFAATMKFFPASASIKAHIIAIKAALVLFDLLTLGLIYLLLRQLNIHIGWMIAYAWNPLVIKEISNGGHLDSIATFLVTSSVCLLVQWSRSKGFRSNLSLAGSAGMALGLGVGAKIFPIVLFPAMFVTIARRQWLQASVFTAMFIVSASLSMWPMYRTHAKEQANRNHSIAESHPNEPQQLESLETGNKEGLTGFLSRWRMNDVVFSGIYLNLKGLPKTKQANAPWFVVTSNRFRTELNEYCKAHSIGGSNPAFFLARITTLSLFATFYLWQLVAIYRSPKEISFDRFTMIMIVFLFLQPTVNPWYWVWVVPLGCLARKSAVLSISGLLLVYYSRFWFKSLSQTYEFGGATYSGVALFDHGVAWLEFIPIVVLLLTPYWKNPSE